MIHPARNRHRGAALLKAYFDESGTHDQSTVVMITGLMGTMDQWAVFEQDWTKLLSNFGLSHFHASACAAREDIFAPLHWSIRRDLFVKLMQIIMDHKLTPVNGTVWRSDWDKFKNGRHGGRYPDPYHLCFEFVIDQMVQWAINHAHGESVAPTFALQDEYATRTLETYKGIQRLPRWQNHLASLVFAPAEDCPALQGADLLGYELYQYTTVCRTDPKLPVRPAMQKLLDVNYMMAGGILPIELIEQHIAEALQPLKPVSKPTAHWPLVSEEVMTSSSSRSS
jgi:Protein of unknown function (DUF3800)